MICEEYCSICLQQNNCLKSINQSDDSNITFLIKLQTIAPTQDWQDFYLVCNECIELLKTSYEFYGTICELATQRKLIIKKERPCYTTDLGIHTIEKIEELKTADSFDCKEDTSLIDELLLQDVNVKYSCDICNEKFNSKRLLLVHKKVKHKDFKADIPDYDGLVENLKEKHCCDICHQKFKSNKLLLGHVKVKHKEYKADISSNKNLLQVVKLKHCCDICNELFNSKKLLVSHQKLKHTNNTKEKKRKGLIPDKFFCELCGEKFSFLKYLTKHYDTVHSIATKDMKPYSCTICNNRFNSSGTLHQHKKYHLGERTFICSMCGKGFITKRDLINHEVIHSDKRNYKCEPCNKSFVSNKNLRTHILIVHTDSKLWRFECSVCGRRFAMKSSFDQHILRHAGEKKFPCHICPDKSFVTNIELRRHLVRHTNVKHNKCEHCSKEYRNKQSLTQHLASSHKIGIHKMVVKEKKHACTFCLSRFYDKNKLVRHVYTHTGERPFSCYACDKRFTDKSYVKGHLKSAHGIIEESTNI